MDSSEFYRLRDDRTNACGVEPRYVHRRVSISIDEAAAASVAGQIAFLLVVNLTSRWCRTIAIDAPRKVLLPRLRAWATEADLGAAAVQVARRADPFGDFRVREANENDWLRVHVGSHAPAGAFRIGSDGWIALAGEAVSAPHQAGHALAAAMAACIGAGRRGPSGLLSVMSCFRPPCGSRSGTCVRATMRTSVTRSMMSSLECR
jgi:hypothetical protein